MDKSVRLELALRGTIAQRDLTLDEARAFDAVIGNRIDVSVAQADFASAPLPDFADVTASVCRALTDLPGAWDRS